MSYDCTIHLDCHKRLFAGGGGAFLNATQRTRAQLQVALK
jgi:hypothetical protein